jgi:Domain of unknown function (DUF4169)
MTADILSLSKARKSKARTAKEQQAKQNRVVFGQTKAEKTLKKAEDKITLRLIEGHKMPERKDD